MKTKRNLKESIVLHNLFMVILPKMYKNPDREFYKYVRDFTKENVKEASEAIVREVIVNLVKEIFVLTNQMWVNNPNQFDEGLIKHKNVFNAIKDAVSNGEKLPFNNRELYKRIRQSIAHNSENIQNFVFNLKGFELNLGKVGDKDYIIYLNFKQIMSLITVLIVNMQNINEKTEIVMLDDGEFTNKEEILNKIKIKNGKTNELIDLDENLLNRMYNYFSFIEPNEKELDDDYIYDFESLPNNAEHLLYEKYKALNMLFKMNSGSCWKDIKPKKLTDIINNYFAITTNLFFNLAASRTNDELEEILSGCIKGLDKEKIRHLRNALCHGRYFHDFNKTFYFYDGKKEFSFEVKLTINEINKILDKIATGEFNVVTLKKIES